MWEFPRLQFALLACLVILAGLLSLDLAEPTTWLLLGANGVVLLYQASWIVPFSRFWPKQVKDATEWDDANRLRILSCNVLMSNRNAHAFLQIVASFDPDVVLALETDAWWERQLSALETHYPHTLKCPLSNRYGMHCYSRLPLEDAKIRFIVEDDVPSMHGDLVLRSGSRIRFHFLHPAPPSPTENAKSVERDGELMRVGLKMAKHSDPVVVCGDLNDVGWSRTTQRFRRVGRLLDPRRGRGMYNSFHANYFFLRWPLDHFFHSEHFFVREIRRLPRIGSDHFPVLLDLQLQPDRVNQQRPPVPDEEDIQQARETMQRAEQSDSS